MQYIKHFSYHIILTLLGFYIITDSDKVFNIFYIMNLVYSLSSILVEIEKDRNYKSLKNESREDREVVQLIKKIKNTEI